MFKIKHLLSLIFLLCIGAVNAQSLSVVDCSTVLIVPVNNQPIVSDSTAPLDGLLAGVNSFDLMLILQTSDVLLGSKVYVELGNSFEGTDLLFGFFDISSNVNSNNLTYEVFSDFFNINISEYQVTESYYGVRLKDSQRNISAIL